VSHLPLPPVLVLEEARPSTIHRHGYRQHKSFQFTTRAWLLRLGR
jgi:hypothetical protein